MTLLKWRNQNGTSERHCSCGSWKNHWKNHSGTNWPTKCSVEGCNNNATLGAHVYSNSVSGEQIIPACDSCNQRTDSFYLKWGCIKIYKSGRTRDYENER